MLDITMLKRDGMMMMKCSWKKNYNGVTKFRSLYDCKKNMEFFFVIGECMLSFDIDILIFKKKLKKWLIWCIFFEPGGFTKSAPILWLKWFWTVQSDFSSFTTVLKCWSNQIHLWFPVQPVEPTSSVRFLKHLFILSPFQKTST